MSIFKKKQKTNSLEFKPAMSQVDHALHKINGLYSQAMGIGDSSTDPVENITVIEQPVHGSEARNLYRNLDLIQRIIDSPVDDGLKNGYKVTTNFDEELGLNELIEKRSEELDLENKLRQLAIHSRLYSKGGLLYPVLDEYEEREIDQPLQFHNLEKIVKLNIVHEEHITYFTQIVDPTRKDYNEITELFLSGFRGSRVHKSRYFHHIIGFDPFQQKGISILDRVKRAVIGINIANWTVTELLRRYRVLIVEADPKTMAMTTGEQKADATSVLKLIARWATSKSVIPVPAGQTFQYLQSQLTDIDKAINTLYDFLGAVSETPQRRIRGASAGELASSDADERQYHEMAESKIQEAIFRPALNYNHKLMLNERSGEIFRTIYKNNIEPDQVSIDIEFEPIASVNPMTEAQVDLINAQTDSIRIQSGVIDAAKAREERFPEFQNEVIKEPDFDAPEMGDLTSISATSELEKMKQELGLSLN